jgi:hypothetical protein
MMIGNSEMRSKSNRGTARTQTIQNPTPRVRTPAEGALHRDPCSGRVLLLVWVSSSS